MIGWDYGNARVGALRSRLLTDVQLRRLGDAGSPEAVVSFLASHDDWRAFVAPSTGEPQGAESGGRLLLDDAVEHHRSARLGMLLRWYEPPARSLVEAVVMPLDLERVLALLRRRRRTATGEGRPGGRIVPGALLSTRALDQLASAATDADMLRDLGRFGVIARRDALALAGRASGATPPEDLEARLCDAWTRARRARAPGDGDQDVLLRQEIDREEADRATVRAALASGGADEAWRAERRVVLDRRARLNRRARRDPLGIAPLLGYRAALELQAFQLRAAAAVMPGAPGVPDPLRDGR